MKRFAAYAIAGVLCTMGAQEALARSVVTANVYLRAGPDMDYPSVVRLRRNSAVRVYGCIDDWYWCDVSSGPYRGWVRSDYINTYYRNRTVTFMEVAPELDVPIISFNIGYWDQYYRNKPFYRDRGRWEYHGWRGRDNDWHGRDHGRDRDDDGHHGRWNRR